MKSMAHPSTLDMDDYMTILNGYAVFMGHLMMGVRGLGVLIITWTTVVLLGGFVSDLKKKDFWCLTGITLIQTAGVFNFLLKEKRDDFLHAWFGLLGAVGGTIVEPSIKRKGKADVLSQVLALFLFVIQTLVLVIILGPIVVPVLYIFGVYISAGVGLWRLIEHDFGNADSGANLEPALEVLYGLAVVQGMLFGYKKIHASGAKVGLAEFVTQRVGSVNKELVSAYLEETVAGCEKDPSFATDRNLVTYAVDLMVEAKSNDDFIAGVKMLGAIIDGDRRVLAKHLLIRSASSSHMIQRLLETLGPRSPYSREVRENAARIVALVAGGIRLEHFPAVIEPICSLLDTFEEYSWVPEDYQRHSHLPKEYERDWLLEEEERLWVINHGKSTDSTIDRTSPESDSSLLRDYTRLVVQGLIILKKLAVREDNCKVIINTEGLLLKITGPVISDQLHRDHHAEWSSRAEESLELMIGLMATPGETGTKLRSEIISGNSKAIISTLGSILECCNCTLRRKEQAVRSLLILSVDPSSIIGNGNGTRCVVPLTWILLFIFLMPEHSMGYMYGSSIHQWKKSSCIRRLAGEKLSAMLPLQSEGSATSRLQSVRVVLGDLSRALVHVGNISNRLHASYYVRNLCINTKDDEYLKEVWKTVVDVMPKLLKEILGWTRDATQAVTEANDVLFSVQDIYLESAGVSQGNGEENTSSSQQQKREQDEDMELQEALIDSCYLTRLLIWSEEGTGWTRQLDEIAEKICLEQGKPVKNFRDLVIEAERELQKRRATTSSSGAT